MVIFMTSKKQFHALDSFKMASSFFVIAIHTSPLSSISADADFILTRIVARTAVPFFLMVTGYFTVSPFLFSRPRDYSPAVRFLKKAFLLYVMSVIIYLPVNIYAGHFRGITAGKLFRIVLFDGTFYHLWYLPASILGLLIILLMSRRLPFPAIVLVSLLLYLTGLFGDSYWGLIENLPHIRIVYERFFQLFSYTRNGIFYVPIFLVMGALLSRTRLCPKITALTGLLISSVFMIVEGLTLHALQMQRHDSMYLALLPCMFFLFQYILSVKVRPAAHLRIQSTWIYLIHPLMILLVRGITKFTGLTSLFVDNSVIHFILVCMFSYLFAVIITYFHNNKPDPDSGKERAWIELNRENLRKNLTEIKNLLPAGCELMPAIKADAYGHGAVLIAKELNACKIKSFCVASVQEAVSLRKNGIKGEILILGYTHPDQFHLLKKYRLIQTVVDYPYAQTLNAYGEKIKVHLKIDTGMHRLGIRSEKIHEICTIFELEHLVVEGIYTHQCASDVLYDIDQNFTFSQSEMFYNVLSQLKERGYARPKTHLQASYGIFNYPELSGDYARVGIALYGVLSNRTDIRDCPAVLHPILSVKARVACVKDLYQGEAAGYGLAYVADRNRKTAVLSIGYADGIPRILSKGIGQVLLNGKKAPIIGNICMDQTLIDVTHIPDAKQGDIAVILGKSGSLEISVYDIAEQAGTITNEILSRMGSRLQRIVV